MTRPIKFRAWDKKRKIMVGTDYPENWSDDRKDFSELWGPEDQLYLEGIETMDTWNRFVLMQFTGLKDKNEKKIYEEDILGHHNNQIDWKSGDGEQAVVMWDKKCSRWDMDFYSIYGGEGHLTQEESLNGRIADKWVVIGNIYENPELLKEKR